MSVLLRRNVLTEVYVCTRVKDPGIGAQSLEALISNDIGAAVRKVVVSNPALCSAVSIEIPFSAYDVVAVLREVI